MNELGKIQQHTGKQALNERDLYLPFKLRERCYNIRSKWLLARNGFSLNGIKE